MDPTTIVTPGRPKIGVRPLQDRNIQQPYTDATSVSRESALKPISAAGAALTGCSLGPRQAS